MVRLGILVTASPLQFENWETAVSLAEAALDRGHHVTLCLAVDGVYAPVRKPSEAATIGVAHARVARLLERGARVLVCGTAAQHRGLGWASYGVAGVTVGGLPDFAMLLGELDRLVSL